MIRFLKAAILFARHQAWVPADAWRPEDAAGLQTFLGTEAGVRFFDSLQNVVIRQQEAAMGTSKNIKFEAGYATGQRGLLAVIRQMADTSQFTTQEEEGANPAANP